jgi:hypothetical protein
MANNPFLPVNFPSGPPTTTKNVWEDGPGIYSNPPNSNTPVIYGGQNQTSRINTKAPYPPPWEAGPGPADPVISSAAQNSAGAYTGSGYGAINPGTLGVGVKTTVSQSSIPTQVRVFKGSDNNLYFLDNDNNTYMVTAGGTLKPVPGVYAPTK